MTRTNDLADIPQTLRHWKDALARDQPAEAEALVEAALSDHPDSALLLRHLAMTHQRRGARLEALKAALRSVALDPDDVESRLLLSALLLQNGLLAEAQIHAEAALIAKPGDPVTLLRLADLALRRGDTTRAHGYVDAAIADNAKNAQAYVARGTIHLAVREYDYATTAFVEAQRLAPNLAVSGGRLAAVDAIRTLALPVDRAAFQSTVAAS